MKIGDGVGIIAILLWLSWSVGPWWLGIVIFVLAFVLNYIQDSYKPPWTNWPL